MQLALFDLDRTLLPIDSADAWSHYLVRVGGLDADRYGQTLRHFADTYDAGRFDVDAYVEFQMGLLSRFRRRQLDGWRAAFIADEIVPHVRPEARALVARYRAAGAHTVLISGTNLFVTTPIGALLGVDEVLGYAPAEHDGEFTGGHVGVPTYREGKVIAVENWLNRRGRRWADTETTFYSDSINDLPLLEQVDRPVVTNGDAALRAIAQARGWPLLELFASSIGDAGGGDAEADAAMTPTTAATTTPTAAPTTAPTTAPIVTVTAAMSAGGATVAATAAGRG